MNEKFEELEEKVEEKNNSIDSAVADRYEEKVNDVIDLLYENGYITQARELENIAEDDRMFTEIGITSYEAAVKCVKGGDVKSLCGQCLGDTPDIENREVVNNYEDVIASYMNSNDLSVEEFAKEVGIDPSYVKEIEQGRPDMPLDIAQKMEGNSNHPLLLTREVNVSDEELAKELYLKGKKIYSKEDEFLEEFERDLGVYFEE